MNDAVLSNPATSAGVAPDANTDIGSPAAPGERRWDLLTAIGLSVLVLLVLLLTRPFANVPMNDDFTYARTAQALAETGKILYNGWGSPLLWPQAAYGALVIRLCGFSYSVLAKTGVATALLATGLFYLLARRCGCNRLYAILATMAMTLNPIFLAIAPSFMTDVPSLALFLLMLLPLVDSIRRDQKGGILVEPRRLIVSALIAVVAGSNRQLIWACELAALVALFALVPRQRRFIAVVTGIVLDCAIAMNYWYDSQPYTVSPDPQEGIRRIAVFPFDTTAVILRYLGLGGLLIFPLAVAGLPRLSALGIRGRTVALASLAWLAAIALPYPTKFRMPAYGVFVYAHYFTSRGTMIGGPPGYIRRPVIFPEAFCALLTVAGAVALGIITPILFQLVCEAVRAVRSGRRQADAEAEPATEIAAPADEGSVTKDRAALISSAVSPRLAIEFVLFAACGVQFIASFLWFCASYIFDRYLLLFIPGFLILMALHASRARVPTALAALSAASVAGMALLGFGMAQEYAAYGHARADLYYALRQHGVPQRNIGGGFELDADAQICTIGYVNSPEVVKPAGAFRPGVKAPHVPFLPEEFPAVDPYYRITTDTFILPKEDAYPTPVFVTIYHSVIPPFERKMFVYRIKR